jgi:hypothetical protein
MIENLMKFIQLRKTFIPKHYIFTKSETSFRILGPVLGPALDNKENPIKESCYFCSNEDEEESDNNMVIEKILIHKECCDKLLKCSFNNCLTFYHSKNTLNCSMCNKIYCSYHIYFSRKVFICNWCNDNIYYFTLWVLKHTPLYNNTDILGLIMDFVPKTTGRII